MGSGTLYRGGSLRLGQLTYRQAPSPNHGPRRDNARPDIVLIHYTAMTDCDAAERVLCNPDLEVSAHYLISPKGDVTQLVAEDRRAWHAGAGSWGSVTDVNSRSIGIELSNDGYSPFAAAQMDALESLLQGILSRWSIPPHRVLGHSDIAPGRKIDPGKRFDWNRLAKQGLAARACPSDADTDVDFDTLLDRIGYARTADPDTRLAAFRLRHNPSTEGAVTPHDIRLAADLAHRFPAT